MAGRGLDGPPSRWLRGPKLRSTERRANSRGFAMRKTNDSYCVVFQGDRIVERYYRDKSG
jgi:hypothetical protein